jgi:signal peptidase I
MVWFVGTVLCASYLLLNYVYTSAIGPTRAPEPAAAPARVARALRDYARALLPVFTVVFVVHQFVVEPFIVSAPSMIPTMLPGDAVLVHKSAYGLRLPISNESVFPTATPRRGDLMAFVSPLAFENGKVYIKRVIGLPGDRVKYVARSVEVNGTPLPRAALADFHYDLTARDYPRFTETIDAHPHQMILFPDDPYKTEGPITFLHPHAEACRAHAGDIECVVPDGHYFMLGDNRDNSLDSRTWGFVPERLVVGRVVFVVWSGLSFERSGRPQ